MSFVLGANFDDQEADQGHGPNNLGGVLSEIDEATQDEKRVALDEVFEVFGPRAFGPIVLIPAVLLLTPIGAVPGVPAIFSVFILLVAGQHALGKERPWIPSRLTKAKVSRDKLEKGLERVRPWAERIDSIVSPRLQGLIDGPLRYVVACVISMLAVAIIPLGFVPFAVMVPAAAITFFGLALVAKDGLMALAGYVATAGTVVLAMMIS